MPSKTSFSFFDLSDRRQITTPRGPERIDVHEHRAPTDSAVKLLMEMEEKAMANIVGRISTPASTGIASEWIVSQDPTNDTLVFHCVYSINGKRETFKVTKDRCGIIGRNINDLLNEVMKDFVAHLARQFVGPLMREVVHTFRPETGLAAVAP
jgi:hypothetical protein